MKWFNSLDCGKRFIYQIKVQDIYWQLVECIESEYQQSIKDMIQQGFKEGQLKRTTFEKINKKIMKNDKSFMGRVWDYFTYSTAYSKHLRLVVFWK